LTYFDRNSIFSLVMRNARKWAGSLMKGLAVAVLTFPLVLMPLGGNACAAPCIPDGPESIHHCSMNASTPALPVHPSPACCVNELLQAEQYVSSRQKSEERKAPSLRNAATPNPWDLPFPSTRSFSHPGSRPLFSKPSDQPLYVIHASFLI